MGTKSTSQANYDILDKILAESDKQNRGHGKPSKDADGNWILTDEQIAALGKSIDDIEKYLRS